MADRNEYPDGTEIHNADRVTVEMSGVCFRRLLWTFEELERQLEWQRRTIRSAEERYDDFRASDIFKDYDDERLRELAERQVREQESVIDQLNWFAREALNEINTKEAVTVVPDPHPNRMW
jgi:hypothetical protein